jgi:uncharacterized membrane protein YciS (DUF1049 family)
MIATSILLSNLWIIGLILGFLIIGIYFRKRKLFLLKMIYFH